MYIVYITIRKINSLQIDKKTLYTIPNVPWDWNIYLHEWLKLMGSMYLYIDSKYSVRPIWSIINMEPENHLFEKENHLPNLHFWVPC